MTGKPAGTVAVILFALLLMACDVSRAGQEQARFFLMGSGRLHLENLRNKESARVSLLRADGSLNEDAFAEVDRVFGYPGMDKGDHISPRLLFMLSYFADRVAPGRLITIESGYRSPEYNEKIRGKGANAARTSTHIDAMALDFRIEGVDGKQLWETIRAADCGGVGHYGGDIVHLDAGRPRFWEAATSGTGSREPDENRHVYLSTDFDRYPRQGTLRLSLSGISTFGFGVAPEILVYGADESETPVARMRLVGNDEENCRIIADRKAARFLDARLPAHLAAGRYRIKLRFCRRPFARMPEEIFSREIELFETPPVNQAGTMR
ncbi:MAG: YcbK family protein [Thermodesulfobacteriota bacterium]